MTIKIDKKTALKLLKKAVNEKGEDYVDPDARAYGCKYHKGENPSCIVGHVFHYAGADLKYSQNDTIPVLAPKLGIKLTPGAFSVLNAAQNAQDLGSTWGQALQRAEEARIN